MSWGGTAGEGTSRTTPLALPSGGDALKGSGEGAVGEPHVVGGGAMGQWERGLLGVGTARLGSRANASPDPCGERHGKHVPSQR